MRYRVVFMGTPEFAVPALRGLLEREEVLAVVTRPDRPRGRGWKPRPSPVKEVARSAGLPVLEPERLRDPEFLESLRELAPDLVVVAAYGKILPREVLELPRFGCWNIHASLLPAYRGADPVRWALIRGERETGITIMQMDEGLDTGPILLQKVTPIGEEETGGELYERLSRLGAVALIEALELHREGKLKPRPQPEEGASYAPPLKKEDARLDFSLSAGELAGRIRAFDPRPGAYTFLKGKLFKLFRPRALAGAAGVPPGTILGVEEGRLLVACGEGILAVEEVQLEGKKRLPVRDFVRGHALEPGERLGP
ncbi:methionyl-tRNA formyltransferase [Thermosulfurimonas sp. F29]|uniref:methionyl-tRNA formyltransferase n=1 Tax=Thermosulfurimonas sp. F29 TaxID=2867247 RepID=UPI001C836578|nr:methionyl-tRNA formyltransferase [Thermosulfurimonas sp. F29]MBX6423548.1 methionyl-tRNA formyltransferase [Thermosulfurimonas sp. F29]